MAKKTTKGSSKKTAPKKTASKAKKAASSKKSSSPKTKTPVAFGEVILEKLTELHQRLLTVELRVQTLELKERDRAPEHVIRLSRYIGENLHSWPEQEIYSFLSSHGHPDDHIADALSHWRRQL